MPVEPSVKIGGSVIRVTNDGSGGQIVENLTSHGHSVTAEPTSDGLTGRDSTGRPLLPSEFSEDTIVSALALGGDGRVRDLLAAGLLVKTDEGFKLAGTQPAVGEQTEQKPEDAALAAEDSAILESLPPLSPEGKDFVKHVTEHTSAEAVSAYVGVLAQGGDVEALEANFASRSGLEPSQVRERAAARVAEVSAAAEKACAALGVSDFQAMSEALWQNPTHASEVVQAAAKLDFGPLLDYARSYQKRGGTSYPIADMMTAELGEGISKRISQDGKTVLLTIRGQEYTFAEAVAAGLVRVSKVSR
jgi:hypothetical protein